MKIKQLFPLVALVLFFSSCTSIRNSRSNEEDIVLLPEIEVLPVAQKKRGTEAMVHDLIHTKLHVKPIWEKRELHGKAELRLKPYFYPSNKLILDAKAMLIQEVGLKTDSFPTALSFINTGQQIEIQLDKTYSRWEEYTILIDYIARPDSVKAASGQAITDNRGLYFINPDSTEANKPTQLWTQGETESSSCWFPTIDQPNERMTQELFINVEEQYQTISNGTLVYSNYLDDGTRTDYWKQELSHAPYLAMMAVGDFIRAVSSWESPSGRNIPVHYYVEREYGPYAFKIFGNTPEMMSFYSELLDYEYPWEKYAQVVVRDYVSGAMENTSAVIHGEFMQQTDRELLDDDYEDVIAHELFHHWFGDLLTCESWSHLAMNESFATYGEYLWEEHKYGKDAADYHLWESADGYFSEAEYKQVPIIRFDYQNPDDMFDAHSYNKGGHVLHMLRGELGDSAFFKGMSLYLKRNEFQDVETDKFRLAMEEVSGRDLKPFFDQWFFSAGHPLVMASFFVAEDTLQLATSQFSSREGAPLFELNTSLELCFEKGKRIIPLFLSKAEEVMNYSLYDKEYTQQDLGAFLYAHLDPKGVLLWNYTESKPYEWWYAQLDPTNSFSARLNALESIALGVEKGEITPSDPSYQKMLTAALNDPHWYIAYLALTMGDVFSPKNQALLEDIAFSKKNTTLRAEAIKLLPYQLNKENAIPKLKGLLKNERSYYVLAASLAALQNLDRAAAYELAKGLEQENNTDLQSSIAWVYYSNNSKEGLDYTVELLNKADDEDAYDIGSLLLLELQMEGVQTQLEYAPVFENMAENGAEWWNRYLGYYALESIYDELLREAEKATDTALKDRLESQAKDLKTRISFIKQQESDQELLYYLD